MDPVRTNIELENRLESGFALVDRAINLERESSHTQVKELDDLYYHLRHMETKCESLGHRVGRVRMG